MPYYELDYIKLLAQEEKVIILSKAQDMAFNEYGYMLSNVIDCILDLQESNFYKSYDYDGQLHDAYRTRVLSLQSFTHKDLYIKFRLNPAQKVIIVSFHTNTLD